MLNSKNCFAHFNFFNILISFVNFFGPSKPDFICPFAIHTKQLRDDVNANNSQNHAWMICIYVSYTFIVLGFGVLLLRSPHLRYQHLSQTLPYLCICRQKTLCKNLTNNSVISFRLQSPTKEDSLGIKGRALGSDRFFSFLSCFDLFVPV